MIEFRFRFAAELRVRVVAVNYVFNQVVYPENAEDSRCMLQKDLLVRLQVLGRTSSRYDKH